MGRYRKIDPRIWNDQKFRTLSDNGKLSFLFVLTHPHMTSLGAMRTTESGLAEELGWTTKAFREAFREALSKGLLKYDQKATCLVVPNFLKYNPPESPNVVVSWEKIIDLIPECNLQVELYQYVKDFLEDLGEAFVKAMPKAMLKTMPNPEPEPEPEQEPDKETPPTPSRGISFSPKKLAELWNEKAPPECPRVDLPLKRNPKDMAKIQNSLKRNPDQEWWERLIIKLFNLPFVRGMNDRGWVITLDVLVRDAEKILDGKYAGGKSAQPKSWGALAESIQRRKDNAQ